MFWTLFSASFLANLSDGIFGHRAAAARGHRDARAGARGRRDGRLAPAMARLRADRRCARRPVRPPADNGHRRRRSGRPDHRANPRGRDGHRHDLAAVRRRVRARLPRDDVRHRGVVDAAERRRQRSRRRREQPAQRRRADDEHVCRATGWRVPREPLDRGRVRHGRRGLPRCAALSADPQRFLPRRSAGPAGVDSIRDRRRAPVPPAPSIPCGRWRWSSAR